jgi:hypothetical protein
VTFFCLTCTKPVPSSLRGYASVILEFMRQKRKLGESGPAVSTVSQRRRASLGVPHSQSQAAQGNSAQTSPICAALDTYHHQRINVFLIDTLPIRIIAKSFVCIAASHSNRHSSEALNCRFLQPLIRAGAGVKVVASAVKRTGRQVRPKLPFSHTFSTNFDSLAPGCYPFKIAFWR